MDLSAVLVKPIKKQVPAPEQHGSPDYCWWDDKDLRKRINCFLLAEPTVRSPGIFFQVPGTVLHPRISIFFSICGISCL